MSVAYTTRTDTLGEFSNYGATNVDLAAPGTNIYSCFYASDNSYLGGAVQGTSYAAAYVSGALALMLAKYPAEPYPLIISRLLNATDPIPALAGRCVTGGRLNLRNALTGSIRLTLKPSATPGLVQLQVISGPNQRCSIQQSFDLLNWGPVLTNITSASGTFEVAYSPSTNVNRLFYRAVTSP